MKTKKGIILAGGHGTRLYPVTKSISKHLLPVYDKPMIYYPLTTLMIAGIKDILVISTPNDIDRYKQLLGNGDQWGISINYEIQTVPDGIGSAFILGKKFINNEPCALILGDNIFYGDNLGKKISKAQENYNGSIIFGYHVNDPERYGVIELDNNNVAISIEEKPTTPKSNCVATGLYFYDEQICDIASSIKPSSREELEITDINKAYIKKNLLKVELLSRGNVWFDTGTHESLLEASTFIYTIQKRLGLMIACPEEIALRSNWISKQKFNSLLEKLKNTSYADYLNEIIQ